MNRPQDDHDEQHRHAVQEGTTGGMGGGGEDPPRDPEKARAFIERAHEGDPVEGDVSQHEADVGADLGADERSEPL